MSLANIILFLSFCKYLRILLLPYNIKNSELEKLSSNSLFFCPTFLVVSYLGVPSSQKGNYIALFNCCKF